MTKTQRCSVSFGALLLLVCAVANTHAQPERKPSVDIFRSRDYMVKPTVYELRCRGGENAFQVAGLVQVVVKRPDGGHHTAYNFSLDFKGGSERARGDGSGLQAGTCSWIDRALNASEPRQIHFDAQPLLADIGWSQQQDKATAMSKYFSDPGHYWSFFVYNDGEGQFQATSHKILIDRSKVGVEERMRRP